MPGLAARRPCQDLPHRADNLSKRHRAEAVEQGQAGVERRGNGRRGDPLERNPTATHELLAGRQPGRGPLADDYRDTLGPGVVDQDRHLAAEAERPRIGHTQGQERRRGRIGRVPAAFENLDARGHRVTTSRRHRTAGPLILPVVVSRGRGGSRRCPTATGSTLLGHGPSDSRHHTQSQGNDQRASDHRCGSSSE